MRRTLALGAVLVGVCAGGPSFAAGAFDGSWTVDLSCPTVGDVEGYVWRFPATIRGGHLTGRYVNARDPKNYGVLTGTIGPGGDGLLTMTGSTGPSEYNVHHTGLHTPIHYDASAHFEATSGSAKRIQQRPCDLLFTKG